MTHGNICCDFVMITSIQLNVMSYFIHDGADVLKMIYERCIIQPDDNDNDNDAYRIMDNFVECTIDVHENELHSQISSNLFKIDC